MCVGVLGGEEYPGGENGNLLQCSCLENSRAEELEELSPCGRKDRHNWAHMQTSIRMNMQLSKTVKKSKLWI